METASAAHLECVGRPLEGVGAFLNRSRALPPLPVLHYAAIIRAIHLCTRMGAIQFVHTLQGMSLCGAIAENFLSWLWVGGANLRPQLPLCESTMPPATPTTFI